ncbi:MAG TPA: DUF4340 domain-containing protein [Candidatus Krumholzibacteriaceae bacterium]
MRIRATTWILLAALAAIVAYFFLVDQRAQQAKEREHRESMKLFPYARADVARFVLINPLGERVEVEHADSGWKVVSPVEAPGDRPAIESFLDQVVPGRTVIELPDVRNLADYGLDKPFATLIMFHKGAAAPDTLFVGDKTPTSSNTYVRVGSSKNVIISSMLTHNVMNRGLFHLRDKNFLPPGYESISAVAVRTGRETLRLKKEGAFWWFAERRVRADRAKIEAYLSRLTDAVVHTFVRENTKDLAPYGLKTPTQQIILTKDQETVAISFGKKEDDLVDVVRTGLDKVIQIEASFLDVFTWNAGNLRAMNLSFFTEDSVKTVRFETSDTSAVFKRTKTKWSTASGDTLAIKWFEVNGLLRKLDALKFDRILTEPLPPGEARLNPFLVRVTLEGAGGSVLDRITIAPAAAGAEIGSSTSANAVGSLPAGTDGELKTILKRIIAR